MYITQMYAHTQTCAHIYSTYTKEGGVGAFTQKQCFRNKSLGNIDVLSLNPLSNCGK